MKAAVPACGAVGAEALRALDKQGIKSALVITCDENPGPVGLACEELGVKAEPAAADDLVKKIKQAGPDLVLTAGFYLETGHGLAAVAKKGAFGLHPSLLPLHPGPDPVARAIMSDEKKTGVTLFRYDESPDRAHVIDACEVWVEKRDDALTLEEKLAQAAGRVLSRSLPAMEKGEGEGEPVDLPEAERPLSPEDGRIDWRKRAWDAFNTVRAMAGREQGAYSYLAGERIDIRKAAPDDTNIGILYPGEFEADQGKVLVGARFGALRLDRVEWQGRTLEGVEIAAVLEKHWRLKFE